MAQKCAQMKPVAENGIFVWDRNRPLPTRFRKQRSCISAERKHFKTLQIYRSCIFFLYQFHAGCALSRGRNCHGEPAVLIVWQSQNFIYCSLLSSCIQKENSEKKLMKWKRYGKAHFLSSSQRKQYCAFRFRLCMADPKKNVLFSPGWRFVRQKRAVDISPLERFCSMHCHFSSFFLFFFFFTRQKMLMQETRCLNENIFLSAFSSYKWALILDNASWWTLSVSRWT